MMGQTPEERIEMYREFRLLLESSALQIQEMPMMEAAVEEYKQRTAEMFVAGFSPILIGVLLMQLFEHTFDLGVDMSIVMLVAYEGGHYGS